MRVTSRKQPLAAPRHVDRRLLRDRRRHQRAISHPDRRREQRRATALQAYLWEIRRA